MNIFPGSSNLPLAKKLADSLSSKLGEIELSRFDNDEVRVWIKEKKIDDKAVVVQSLSQPTDHNLVEMVLICDALKRMGVKEIVGVIPWLGYSKQDKVFRKGEPLSVEVVVKMLQVAGMSKMITFDLHSSKVVDYFSVPVVNLSAFELLADQVDKSDNQIVVSPDKGSIEMSQKLSKKLDCPIVYLNKERDLNTGKVKVTGIDGEVKGKKVVMIDDMIATGSTLIETSNFLKDLSVQSIKVLVTHHLYVDGAQENLDKSFIDKLVVTDTVSQKEESEKLEVVSVVDVLKKEILI